jgi:phosphatidylserine synthase
LARFNVQMIASSKIPYANSNDGKNEEFSENAHHRHDEQMNSQIENNHNKIDNHNKIEGKNKKTAHFFTGIPITIAAFLFITPLFLSFKILRNTEFEPIYIMFYSLILGLLMVSRIPTLSTKHMRIHKRYIRFTLAISAILITFVLLEPWIVLPFFAAAYLVTIPFTCYASWRNS